MTPQAYLLGSDYSVYYDLIAVVGILVLCMIVCTAWLLHRKRSAKFILSVWVGFSLLLLFGSAGILFSIQSQRLLWRTHFSKMVACYADIVMRLNHWEIQPGNPEVFSNWSSPCIVSSELPDEQKLEAVSDPVTKKLPIPLGLIAAWEDLKDRSNELPHHQRRNQWAVAALTKDNAAYENCSKQIVVRWERIPDATAYRLQWGIDRSNNVEWFDVYSGSKPYCTLTAPEKVPIIFRVRAENGTPEDDSTYVKLTEAVDFGIQANDYSGYGYTMRRYDTGRFQFIVAPISDANHNGQIDLDETPCSIGEFYPATPLENYVWEHKTRTMSFTTHPDKWGKWFTIMEPIYTPDKKLDGLFAIDFHVNAVHHQMFIERIYPLILFILVTFLYFAAVLSFNRLQVDAEEQRKLANKLQIAVLELIEAKKIAEKASQTKTLFLTNMSHELRTPLNAMLGFTEILAIKIASCPSVEKGVCNEAVDQMKENGKNLLGLIDNILGTAAMETNQSLRLSFVPVNFPRLIGDIADMMRSRAENKALRLMVTKSPDVPEWIWSDPAHIRQILIHLVGNAVKFTKQGSVKVRFGIQPFPPEQLRPNQQMFFVSISDTGIGIAQEQLKIIFEPFVQSDQSLTRVYGGAGLGLSVAQQTAEILNGHISVESVLGQGSTFTLTLPAQIVHRAAIPAEEAEADLEEKPVQPVLEMPQTESAVEERKSAVILPLSGRRILVVEDTKVNQMVISAQLKQVGASVEVADNGQIGIEKIREAENSKVPFDVILMDMQMPVLDGYEATRQLRTDGFKKPIIAVTAHALAGDREKVLAAGCDEYVTKPVDYDHLFATIQSFLTIK